MAALAVVAPLQLVAMTTGGDPGRGVTRAGEMAAYPPPVAAPVAEVPVQLAAPASTQTPPAPASAPLVAAAERPVLVTEPDVMPAPAAPAATPVTAAVAARGPATFADRFPAQAAAVQDVQDPATTRWAVLIGINEHRGRVADNIGSRQDAEDLRAHLLASGWRDDHILLLTDRSAIRANIVDGLAWLAEKTDQDSVAVFHYSGHSKKWRHDVDGDSERIDEGLWPHDDRYIPDGELVQLLDPVQPHAFWISFATCNAAGMADPGLAQPGRILTFSSGEPQKSYENPAWANSVWGWLMIEQAFAAGMADVDGDDRVTVEEAFAWSRPRASETTRGQRYGPQDGVIVDQVPGGFDLLIPGAPRPARQVASEPDADQPDADQPGPQPEGQPAPPPEQDEQQPPREPSEDNHGNRICILCGP